MTILALEGNTTNERHAAKGEEICFDRKISVSS